MILDSTQALTFIALRGSVIIGPAARDREETLWIERARSGDEAGYRWLLSRYRDRIVRLAAGTLGAPYEAEDAAQEAFVKAFRSLSQFQGSGSFYAWLCRIAVRIALDRKRLKRSSEIALADVEPSLYTASHADKADTAVVVRQLLQELAPPMRAALVLRELDGLEYAEVAAALNIPVGTVRSRLNAARAQFKVLWENAMREEDADGVRS